MKQINKFRMGAFLACALIMSACVSRPADIHNSRISVDWAGTYAGLIPSASGSGIEVRLTLNRDETYALHYRYVGREEPDFRSTGKFTWDKTGSNITLDSGPEPGRYKVGENRLWHLDMRGRVIMGNLADMYILRKE